MRFILAAFLWGGFAAAADVPIRLPDIPVAPQPMPSPGAATRLTADKLFVIDSDVQILVLASPEGVVSVTEEAGPLTVRAVFVDGGGKPERRTYKGKHVFIVEAVQTGRVELLVVPVGASKPADVIRRVIDADAGQGPRPPPTPPDPKPPTPPDPTPQPVAQKLYVAIVRDPMGLTVAQATLIGDLPFWNSLKAAGHEWDSYTSQSGDAEKLGYLKAVRDSGVSLPAVLLMDKATGKVLKVAPLPNTKAEVTELLKGVTK